LPTGVPGGSCLAARATGLCGLRPVAPALRQRRVCVKGHRRSPLFRFSTLALVPRPACLLASKNLARRPLALRCSARPPPGSTRGFLLRFCSRSSCLVDFRRCPADARCFPLEGTTPPASLTFNCASLACYPYRCRGVSNQVIFFGLIIWDHSFYLCPCILNFLSLHVTKSSPRK
jgi:hypothetical protein